MSPLDSSFWCLLPSAAGHSNESLPFLAHLVSRLCFLLWFLFLKPGVGAGRCWDGAFQGQSLAVPLWGAHGNACDDASVPASLLRQCHFWRMWEAEAWPCTAVWDTGPTRAQTQLCYNRGCYIFSPETQRRMLSSEFLLLKIIPYINTAWHCWPHWPTVRRGCWFCAELKDVISLVLLQFHRIFLSSLPDKLIWQSSRAVPIGGMTERLEVWTLSHCKTR